MRRLFAFVMTLVLLSFPVIRVFAYSQVEDDSALMVGTYTNAENKSAFAEKARAEYAQALFNNEALEYDEERVRLLLEAASFANINEQDAIHAELAQYGVYYYSEVQHSPATASDSSDVRLSAPNIYYVTTGQYWYVTFSGYWATDEWRNEIEQGSANIGGRDAYGVYFRNTSGTFNSAITDSYLRISNVGGGNPRYTETLSSVGVNDEDGFYFELQDRIVNNTYQGEEWYGWCIYDNNFGSYSGYAYAFYVHTYNDCVISSITLSASPSDASFDVVLVNEQFGFDVRSNSTRFNRN